MGFRSINQKLGKTFYLSVFAIILLDQMTKQWAASTLMLHHPNHVNSFMNFTLIHNAGAAFGFLRYSGGWQRWFFLAVALFVCVYLVRWLSRKSKTNTKQCLAVAAIFAGAIGNIVDRLSYGYVVDFIDLHVGYWHWPAFNIADVAICIGVLMLFFVKTGPSK